MSPLSHGMESITGMDMPAKCIGLHGKAEPFTELTLPEKNPFIADNFSIVNLPVYTAEQFSNGYGYNRHNAFYRRIDNNMTHPYAGISISF